jgi:hypothetical protein
MKIIVVNPALLSAFGVRYIDSVVDHMILVVFDQGRDVVLRHSVSSFHAVQDGAGDLPQWAEICLFVD